MQSGNIVSYNNALWRVERLNSKSATAILWSWAGNTMEVASDDPEVKVVTVPIEQWVLVPGAIIMNQGPYRKLCLTRSNVTKELVPLEEWVPSDPYRDGGSVLVSPNIQLELGEVLVATHNMGRAVKLTVTQKTGTAKSRKRVKKPVPKITLKDHLDDF